VVTVSRQNADIADTLKLRDVVMATWQPLFISSAYSFGCVIASDRLFDSKVGFGIKLSKEDIAEIEALREVAIATVLGLH